MEIEDFKTHLRIVCISDTHNKHRDLQLPKGDVLVHTGDFTLQGLPSEITDFSKWLGEQPFAHKLVISGNHEITFDLEHQIDLNKMFFRK